jgi:hypothetical protein
MKCVETMRATCESRRNEKIRNQGLRVNGGNQLVENKGSNSRQAECATCGLRIKDY